MPHGPMFAMSQDAGIIIPAFGFVTVLYLVLCFIVVWRTRPLEFRLIMLGVLTGVAAVWCGLLGSTGAVSLQGATGQVDLTVGVGGAAATLGRIAILLVLGGLVFLFLNRPIVPVTANRPERDVP